MPAKRGAYAITSVSTHRIEIKHIKDKKQIYNKRDE
jgi:hypothetical protein